MPTSKLTIPTITGTHTGIEEGHLGTGMVGAGLELGVGLGVTAGLRRLLILVKMKGLAYRKQTTAHYKMCQRIFLQLCPNILKIQPQRPTLQFRDYGDADELRKMETQNFQYEIYKTL